MNVYIRLFFVIMLLWLAVPAFTWSYTEPYDPNTCPFTVSLQQAEDIVRTWAGDPNLQIVLRGVNLTYYVFDSVDETQLFGVHGYDGYLIGWVNTSLSSAFDSQRMSENPGEKLTEDQLALLMQQFASQKYPGYSELNLQQINCCHFVRLMPEGVWDLGFYCGIGIDCYTGDVFNYQARRSGPVTVSTTPTITQAQAEAIALGAFSDTSANSIFLLANEGLWIDRGDEVSVQRLAWDILVVLSEEENYTLEQYLYHLENELVPYGGVFYAKVDAHTGEVYYRDSASVLGGGNQIIGKASIPLVICNPKPITGKKIQYPITELTIDGKEVNLTVRPIVIDDVPYISIRQLALLAKKPVSWESGRIVLAGGKKAELIPETCNASMDGTTVKLTHPVRILFSRAYMSYEDIEQVFGIGAKWDKQSDKLDLITVDP